ncbi:MAG: archease [Candidatus Rokubacteria bacterium]|nr:archease [Candidatus Rokubacteria bacterium]
MSAPAGYAYFDVAADVGVRAWGPTLPEAFAQTALGVFALMVDPLSVERRESREVRAQADSREALLVNWLNECLYLHDIEGFVVHRIEVPVFEAKKVHALLWGEALDPARHRVGTLVKAATFHQLQITESDGGWDIRVILDI